MEELKNNSVVEEDTEGTVVVITDEEGNEIGDMPEKRKKAKKELIKIGEDKIAKKYIF